MRSTFARFAALPAAAALLAAVWAMPAFAAPAALSPGQFIVVNNTSFTIASLYVGQSDSNTWGDDLLAGQDPRVGAIPGKELGCADDCGRAGVFESLHVITPWADLMARRRLRRGRCARW